MDYTQEHVQFPFQIYELEESEANELKQYYTGDNYGFVRVGPKRYFIRHKYKEQAEDIYNLHLRSDDVFVVGYPRSGCTLMRELVWLLSNDFDYAKASAVPLSCRFALIEYSIMVQTKLKDKLLKENEGKDNNKLIVDVLVKPASEHLAATPSPRFMLSHLPLSLLPPRLLDSSKVVYMARDPRDVIVSLYHLSKLFKILGFGGDFQSYWSLFRKDCSKTGGWRDYFTEEMEQQANDWIFENLSDTDLRYPSMTF